MTCYNENHKISVFFLKIAPFFVAFPRFSDFKFLSIVHLITDNDWIGTIKSFLKIFMNDTLILN